MFAKYLNKILIVIIALSTLLFPQCQSPIKKTKAIDSLSRLWISDKEGCAGFRNNTIANKLVNSAHLISHTKNDFINIFGNPDTVENYNNQEILVYYWGGICEAKRLIKQGDKCYANFHFKSDKLITFDFPCE